MRLSSIVLFVFAILMGLGAVILTMNWMDGQRSAPVAVAVPVTKTHKVVIAAQPLRFGTELTSLNLKEVDWPSGVAPEGSFSSIAALTKSNERRVALVAVERGEPVLASKITGAGQRATLSAVIGQDKKAITIRVDDVSGTAGFVLPGDRVDVLVTRTEDKSGYTDVLLQNIRILGIDQLADERTEKPTLGKAVTLEVYTTEAQKLALAERMGRLSLILRQAGAATTDATRRISLSDLGELEPALTPALRAQSEPIVLREPDEEERAVPARALEIRVSRPKKAPEGGFNREDIQVKHAAGRR